MIKESALKKKKEGQLHPFTLFALTILVSFQVFFGNQTVYWAVLILTLLIALGKRAVCLYGVMDGDKLPGRTKWTADAYAIAAVDVCLGDVAFAVILHLHADTGAFVLVVFLVFRACLDQTETANINL